MTLLIPFVPLCWVGIVCGAHTRTSSACTVQSLSDWEDCM